MGASKWLYKCNITLYNIVKRNMICLLIKVSLAFYGGFVCGHVSILRPLITVFQTADDVSSGFQSQSGQPYYSHCNRGLCDVCSLGFSSCSMLTDSLTSANKAAYSGFETERRYHQKSKIGVSVVPQKVLMSSKI